MVSKKKIKGNVKSEGKDRYRFKKKENQTEEKG